MSGLIPLAEAQARVLALAEPVEIETLPIEEAAGRWAAADIVALRTQPARDLSAMDGYAIRFDDMPGPWRRIGESAAGARFEGAIRRGETVRIFTGAALPEGADAILVQEEATAATDTVALAGEGPPRRGAHIRPAGSDFRAGDLLVRAGDALTPARIALTATGGHGLVATRRRITVALISTGNELVPPSGVVPDDRIPASNAPMLRAMLARLPVTIHDMGIVADEESALLRVLADAHYADVMVTTGGASVGDRDLVGPVLEKAGAALDFWKIAMKPGKPLMAGTLGEAVVLGLPGNPVSAFVTARLFLIPLIAHLSGAFDPLPRLISARLARALPAGGGREEYLRGRWEDGAVQALGEQGSGNLRALGDAEVLIRRPIGAPAAQAGDMAEVLILD